MFDTAHVETADEMLQRTINHSDFVDLCEDYFKISIGVRRPSKPEIDAALENQRGAFHPTNPTPEERVQAMMYPLANSPTTIRMVLAHEFVVYQVLARETSILDQPYLPMLRYELQMQDELASERRYNEAIVRQAALFQTYLRMKEGNFKLRWKDCLCHGLKEITPPRVSAGTKRRMERVYDTRSGLGHDWTVYVEPSPDRSRLQVFAQGRWVIHELRNVELNELYESYTSHSSSLRLPVRFEARERATATVSGAEVSITRNCPECGKELDEDPDFCRNCGWTSKNSIGINRRSRIRERIHSLLRTIKSRFD